MRYFLKEDFCGILKKVDGKDDPADSAGEIGCRIEGYFGAGYGEPVNGWKNFWESPTRSIPRIFYING